MLGDNECRDYSAKASLTLIGPSLSLSRHNIIDPTSGFTFVFDIFFKLSLPLLATYTTLYDHSIRQAELSLQNNNPEPNQERLVANRHLQTDIKRSFGLVITTHRQTLERNSQIRTRHLSLEGTPLRLL